MRSRDTRISARQRGYDWRWEKARAAFLRQHPLCAEHQRRGLLAPATVVDHVVPHRGDMTKFWDQSQWQSLCKACHDSHKQLLEHGKDAPVAVRGCDVNGVPIDPGFGW